MKSLDLTLSSDFTPEHAILSDHLVTFRFWDGLLTSDGLNITEKAEGIGTSLCWAST